MSWSHKPSQGWIGFKYTRPHSTLLSDKPAAHFHHPTPPELCKLLHKTMKAHQLLGQRMPGLDIYAQVNGVISSGWRRPAAEWTKPRSREIQNYSRNKHHTSPAQAPALYVGLGFPSPCSLSLERIISPVSLARTWCLRYSLC